MSDVKIKVDTSGLKVSLGRLNSSLLRKDELMRQLGTSQLASFYRTFREQGSPAGSWAPLAPSTIRSDPKFYDAGHLLLAGRTGLLRNSVKAEMQGNKVVIGSGLRYAAVHQYGSRDRSVAIGPQTEAEAGATVGVKTHGYFARQHELGAGHLKGAGRRKFQGPQPRPGARYMDRLRIVSAHERHQNIPPRPYLVFRPEDPERLRGIVVRYINKAIKDAGLGGGGN